MKELCMPQTSQAVEASNACETNLKQLKENQLKIKTTELPKLNNELKKVAIRQLKSG
jgi:hypothetical protein